VILFPLLKSMAAGGDSEPTDRAGGKQA